MKVVKSSRIVFFDVDDTLLMWDWEAHDPQGTRCISITDPESGVTSTVFPHTRHIELMREFKTRGHTVVVWSQGGHAWAEAVCKTLQLENMVDFVFDKPNWYVDDISSDKFMKEPIYLHPTDPSKDNRWGSKDEPK